MDSVVKASPQRSGGPWRRVPRAARTQTSTQRNSTTPRTYQGAAALGRAITLSSRGLRWLGRVARSMALNTRYSTQVAKAQASR